MLDGENKDLTMESDFLGMFNPVRGLKKKENSGSNPESPSLTVENLAPLLIDAMYDNDNYRDALRDFIADRDSTLKPFYVTDCDFLRNVLNVADLEARAEEALQNNIFKYLHWKTLSEKFRNIRNINTIIINAKMFSDEGVEVYFNVKHVINFNNVCLSALNIPEVLKQISDLDSSLDSIAQLQYLENTGLEKINLAGDNAVIDIDTTSPDNPTLVYGNVSVNNDAIVEGLNKLTGTYDENSKSFSIYINDTLYTTVHNMNKWNNLINIYFFDCIDHIVYPNYNNLYKYADGSLPKDIKGFNKQYFVYTNASAHMFDCSPEISLNSCFFNTEFECFGAYYSVYVCTTELEKAVYYCSDNIYEYGLYNNLLIQRVKKTNIACNRTIDNLKYHLDICLGKALPW